MSRYLTVDDILNRVALEVGLLPSSSPVTDTDETFIQLVGLFNSSGQELCELNDWQILQKPFEINTSTGQDGTSGKYPLPTDFNYFIDQTGWDRKNDVPLAGPLSAQDWTYLEGRDLVSSTIYASYRPNQGAIWIYPQPTPDDMQLTFEYISRNWLQEQGQTSANRDTVGAGSDICILDPLLSIKFLKLKFLQAKGFDYSAAAMEFDTLLASRIGKSVGAPILSASRTRGGMPYLSTYGSTPDSGYGR
jgi:hypothetical protein